MTTPNHVAIIMDGNGRWASRAYLPRTYGHRMGVEALKQAVDFALNNSISVLTVFALSTENMCRPGAEIQFLFALLSNMLQREVAQLHNKGVCIRFIGDMSVLPDLLLEEIKGAEVKTMNNNSLTLNVAFNYSGRWDIAQVARMCAERVVSGLLMPNQIDERYIQDHIKNNGVPDIDLLIRTGGELRISNFMLWSLAYAELFFTDVFWPDFNHAIFANALAFFASRERRFGLLSGGEYE